LPKIEFSPPAFFRPEPAIVTVGKRNASFPKIRGEDFARHERPLPGSFRGPSRWTELADRRPGRNSSFDAGRTLSGGRTMTYPPSTTIARRTQAIAPPVAWVLTGRRIEHCPTFGIRAAHTVFPSDRWPVNHSGSPHPGTGAGLRPSFGELSCERRRKGPACIQNWRDV